MSQEPPYPHPDDPRFLDDAFDAVFGFMLGVMANNGYTPAQLGAKVRNLVRVIVASATGEHAVALGAATSAIHSAAHRVVEQLPDDVKNAIAGEAVSEAAAVLGKVAHMAGTGHFSRENLEELARVIGVADDAVHKALEEKSK